MTNGKETIVDDGGLVESSTDNHKTSSSVSNIATPSVGMRFDFRDEDFVWSAAYIVAVEKESDEVLVTVRCDGWGAEWDEQVPWPSERFARLYTYTKNVKCFVDLLSKSKKKAKSKRKNSMNLWPCRVQFRMPHPFQEGGTDEEQCLGAQDVLRIEENVFVQPYGVAHLPKEIASSLNADGGLWLHTSRLRLWRNNPIDLGIFHDTFAEAFEEAKNDSEVPGLLLQKALVKGSLLDDTFRVHSIDPQYSRGALVASPTGPNKGSLAKSESMKATAHDASMQDDHDDFSDSQPVRKKAKRSNIPDLWSVTGVDETKGLKEISKILPLGLKNSSQQVAHFFLFLYERQMIWERRNGGESEPYTESIAMQNYFFCNNYRELDRGTNFFRAHVLTLWEKGQFDQQSWIEAVLWASVCYRLVNRISTFEDFGYIPEVSAWPEFKKFMCKSHQLQKTLFTNAHVTGGYGPYISNMSALHKSKGKVTIKTVSQQVLECCRDKDLEGCFLAVKTIDGVGNFLAWQVVCDMMESQCLKPCTENDWTELGPGAKGGIDVVFGNRKNYSYLELAMCLQKCQDAVFDALGLNFPKWNGVPLTLKNIEHPLCEFKKYSVIQGKLGKNRTVGGQRLNNSRTSMDFKKACHYVKKCGVQDDVLFCDKCLVGFCESCTSWDSTSGYWVCPRCTRFEAITFERGSK